LCPYGSIGDILWVREQFGWFGSIISGSYGYVEPEKPRYPPHVLKGGFKRPVVFKADYPKHRFDPNDSGWKPSIFMPKTACRIWLEITDRRIEILQDITEEDAKAEGINYTGTDEIGCPIAYEDYLSKGAKFKHSSITGKNNYHRFTAVSSYKSLWEYINGKGSWAKNHWVWVIEFKVKEILK
jgi:hypothetical protein